MNLKQSVVIVNEFTVKTAKGGSRGGTPGDYVLRYMGRDKATENLTPVRLTDAESYIQRYMAREEASESLSSVPEIKEGMRDADGMGGVAFGYGDVSLSDAKLRACSKDIQKQFDNGKTVMKTVLSFNEEYLKSHGVVDEDFEFKKRGDYRGNIDQMKLRMAIMNGLDKMSRQYDDLQYVGVIQVDTAHVHCHLAMVDRGEGKLAPDGRQKGKITEKSKRDLRRGIDDFLDEHQAVKQMASNVDYDKRNALCYIKKFTHKTMDEHGLPQFLLACLPEDKRLWRAGTNRAEMRKPNYIVREYVTQVLDEPDSGYKQALQSVDRYAQGRQQREGLSHDEYRRLYRDGQEQIIRDCMNGVYGILKRIPDSERSVRTPMMTAMAMPYEDMSAHAQSDTMIEFGFKLRSYSSRLSHHKKETRKYHAAVEAYENTENKSEDARPLYDYLKFEEEYNAKLMCKYQHFLMFLPPTDEYQDGFNDLMDYRGKIKSLQAMKGDPSCQRMSPKAAERYGREVYGMHGGQYVATAPQILDTRLDIMQITYGKKEADFRFKLAEYGMTLESDETGARVSRTPPYSFDTVKALDLHHMGYDFNYDVNVSKPNIDEFVDAANMRYALFQGAKEYLVRSGQEAGLQGLPERDINLMKDMADRLAENPVLLTDRPSTGRQSRGRTVRLDVDYRRDMDLVIRSTVESIQFGE